MEANKLYKPEEIPKHYLNSNGAVRSTIGYWIRSGCVFHRCLDQDSQWTLDLKIGFYKDTELSLNKVD
jgi:hypothetical protein